MNELPVNLRYLIGTDNRKLDMVVVIPVARCEWHLAMKLLAWMDGLRDSPEVIIYCAPSITEPEREKLRQAYGSYCGTISADFVDTGYFGGANNMFIGALKYVESNHPGKAMLWLEADVVPMRSGWFADILDEYRGCGQPFLGDTVLCEINHVTGNACYHPNWRTIAPSLAELPGPDPEWGWDTQNADDTFTRCRQSKLIQQIWRPPLPITAAWAAENLWATTAIFHQVKDGSLIDILCDKFGFDRIPDLAPLESSTYAKGRQNPYGAENAARLSRGARMIAGMREEAAPPTSLFYVTCARDMDFLRYSLKSAQKYASGFAGITIVVPESERGLYDWVKKASVIYVPEPEGKGFLAHMIAKCRADEYCPDAEMIVHMDPDVIFWKPCTPLDFMSQGKPLVYRERYADLRNPNRKVWQGCVENALGFKPEYETMVCHSQVRLRSVYAKTRALVEAHTGMPFDAYVLSCKNSFPQSFAEHMTTGAVAIAHFRHAYTFRDYDWAKDAKECGVPVETPFQYLYRKDRDPVCETWSHGGIEQYRSDIEAWIAGRVPRYFIK